MGDVNGIPAIFKLTAVSRSALQNELAGSVILHVLEQRIDEVVTVSADGLTTAPGYPAVPSALAASRQNSVRGVTHGSE